MGSPHPRRGRALAVRRLHRLTHQARRQDQPRHPPYAPGAHALGALPREHRVPDGRRPGADAILLTRRAEPPTGPPSPYCQRSAFRATVTPLSEGPCSGERVSVNHGIFRPVKSGRLPRFSTQVLLGLLILLLLGPGLAFTGMLLLRYATVERERYSLEALTTARQIAAVIDRELNGLTTTLSTLTTSTRLRAGDFATFHDQAEQVSKLTGAHVVLRAPNGQQLVNTAFPWGAALGPVHIAIDAGVIADLRAGISDVFIERATGRPVFAVVVPVVYDGKLRYLLSIE